MSELTTREEAAFIYEQTKKISDILALVNQDNDDDEKEDRRIKALRDDLNREIWISSFMAKKQEEQGEREEEERNQKTLAQSVPNNNNNNKLNNEVLSYFTKPFLPVLERKPLLLPQQEKPKPQLNQGILFARTIQTFAEHEKEKKETKVKEQPLKILVWTPKKQEKEKVIVETKTSKKKKRKEERLRKEAEEKKRQQNKKEEKTTEPKEEEVNSADDVNPNTSNNNKSDSGKTGQIELDPAIKSRVQFYKPSWKEEKSMTSSLLTPNTNCFAIIPSTTNQGKLRREKSGTTIYHAGKRKKMRCKTGKNCRNN